MCPNLGHAILSSKTGVINNYINNYVEERKKKRQMTKETKIEVNTKKKN